MFKIIRDAMATRNLRGAVLALGLFAGPMQGPALALEFSKHANDSETENAIQAAGDIVQEDAFRFLAYLSKLPPKKVTAIYLDSTGGSIQGAMSLGRQLRKSGVRAYAIDGRGCLSACAYVLVGGRDGPEGKPFRVKGTTTRLGLHHFTPVLENKPSFTLKEMHATEARAQKVALDLALYMEEVEADIELLGFGLKQTEMYYLKNEEALPLGIHVYDTATKELVLSDPFVPRRR